MVKPSALSWANGDVSHDSPFLARAILILRLTSFALWLNQDLTALRADLV